MTIFLIKSRSTDNKVSVFKYSDLLPFINLSTFQFVVINILAAYNLLNVYNIFLYA